MPIATRSQTGKIPPKVIQTAAIKPKKPKKPKKSEISKKLNDDFDDASPLVKDYSFNSESGEITYFSFQYHPLRRNIKNNSIANITETPQRNNLPSPVPFGLIRRNTQDMPGASSINEVNI